MFSSSVFLGKKKKTIKHIKRCLLLFSKLLEHHALLFGLIVSLYTLVIHLVCDPLKWIYYYLFFF